MADTLFYKNPVARTYDMCDNVSELLMRTNPKLTTNVKIITNGDRVYLESFNANSEISLSRYKAFKTYSNGLYNKDLSAFWKDTGIVHAYDVLQEYDNTTVKEDFASQYETFYWYGCEYIKSLEYDEPYGILAPLWIGDRIPERFVIFRIPDPAYCKTTDRNASGSLPDIDFKHDILEKCEIIRTFDLTENSRIGSYIRKYRNQSGFPESPVTLDDKFLSFNGIDYETGEFTSKKEHYHERFFQHDETVLEFDKYITDGFERNGVVVANIMNIEFLFGDSVTEDYKFSRYFGMYCDVMRDGTFSIAKDGLYGIGNEYKSDIQSFKNWNNREFPVSNPDGVLLPFETGDVSDPDTFPMNTVPENRFDDPNRIPLIDALNSVFCIEDKNGDLHSIDRATPPVARTPLSIQGGATYSTIRISDRETDFKNFKGCSEIVASISAEYEDTPTPSSIELHILSQIPHYTKIQLFKDTVSTNGTTQSLVAEITSAGNLDPNGNVIVPIGGCDWDMFCGDGSAEEIAIAICKSFNISTDAGIHAYSCSDSVYLISPDASPAYNAYSIRVDTTQNGSDPDDFIKIGNNGYLHGSNRYEHVKCSSGEMESFAAGDYVPVKTKEEFGQIVGIVKDFDNAVFNGDKVVFTNNDLYDILIDSPGICVTRANTVKIYRKFRPSYCRLSFYPVKDFEMSQMHDTSIYGDLGELKYDNGTQSILVAGSNATERMPVPPDMLREIIGTISGNETFTIRIGTDGKVYASSRSGDYTIIITPDYESGQDTYIVRVVLTINDMSQRRETDSVTVAGDFQYNTLSTTLNVPNLTYLKNEYERCYENCNPYLMTLSKTQPWVCGWVITNGTDVREKPYRLNSNPVFGRLSFTPDMTEHAPDPEFYNQEWMYIMTEYPDIITNGANEKKVRSSWSYIGENIYDKYDFENKLRSSQENWFDVYFKRDHVMIGGQYYSTPDYMRKYSITYGGTGLVNARAFFRGVTVEFIMKSDWSADARVDNNIDNLKTAYGTDLNGYKFTAVCIPLYGQSDEESEPLIKKKIKIIRNDVFKNITLIHYATGSYVDAVDANILNETNPYVMEINPINRYMMYNSMNDDTMQQNTSVRPVSVKGYGTVTDCQNVSGNTFRIIGTDTSFLSDFMTYDDTQYNYSKEILLERNSNGYIDYAVFKITGVESNTTMFGTLRPYSATPSANTNICYRMRNIPNIQNLFVNSSGDYRLHGQWDTYYIINANYTQMLDSYKQCVFATVKMALNNTQKDDVTYELVDKNGVLHSSDDPANPENTFAVKIIEPMENAKYEYMSLLYDGEYVTYGTYPSHASPMYRSKGRFMPLRNDIIWYCDPFVKEFSKNPNIEDPVKEKLFTGSRHMNTCFDYTLSDFGMIKDVCFHRTNEMNRNIFKLDNSKKAIYPSSNRFAIGKRDIMAFNSSWDPWYFTRTLSNTMEEDCHGTLSMLENKSMFGSKCLKTPDIITFETFDNDDYEVAYDTSHIEITIHAENKLRKHLSAMLGDLFRENIDSESSYGDKTTVDDDIDEYITRNLLDIYKIKEVTLWVRKDSASAEPWFEWSGMLMDNTEKSRKGLDITYSIGITTFPENNFDRKIILNIRNRMRYTIGMSVSVERK